MRVIEIEQIKDNPHTSYRLVFGHNVSNDKVLRSLIQAAKIREKLGLTTAENTAQTIKEAKSKLENC